MSNKKALLEIEQLHVSYGGIRAVRGIDLYVQEGEIVCLIGANGAGKSTTLRAICGLEPIAQGNILYDGVSIVGKPSYELVRQGLVMVPEGRGIFGQLTIEENLAVGGYCRQDRQHLKLAIDEVFAWFPRLAERRKQSAGTLSGGEQQMLAMGRAMIAKPALLLLDEPSMGLAPQMVEKLFEVINTIAQQGVTILLIEQNARLALETSHRCYVMESGQILLTDEATNLLDDPRIRAAYLGEEDVA